MPNRIRISERLEGVVVLLIVDLLILSLIELVERHTERALHGGRVLTLSEVSGL